MRRVFFMQKICNTIKKILIVALSAVFLFLAAKTGAKSFFSDYEGIKEIYFENGSFTEGIAGENDSETLRAIRGKKGEGIFTTEDCAQRMITDFNAELVFEEEICGGKNFYYYSEKLPFSAKIKGKTVNLQIYCRGKAVKAGIPVIYGSF